MLTFDKLLEINIDLLSTGIESAFKNIVKELDFYPKNFSNDMIVNLTKDIKKFSIREIRSKFFEHLEHAVCNIIKLISGRELVSYMLEHGNQYVRGDKIGFINNVQDIINDIYIDNIKNIYTVDYSKDFNIAYAWTLMSTLLLDEEYIKKAVASNDNYKEFNDNHTLKIIINISNKINPAIYHIPYQYIFEVILNYKKEIKTTEAKYIINALFLVDKATLYFDENIKNLNSDNLTADSCVKIVDETINIMKLENITKEDKEEMANSSFRLKYIEECVNIPNSSSKRMRKM